MVGEHGRIAVVRAVKTKAERARSRLLGCGQADPAVPVEAADNALVPPDYGRAVQDLAPLFLVRTLGAHIARHLKGRSGLTRSIGETY